MGLNNSFINDITMFFIGAIIGTLLHFFMQWVIESYEVTSMHGLLFLGVFQLLLVAFSAKLLSSILSIQGFFILGIISSQDLIIYKIYPKNNKS